MGELHKGMGGGDKAPAVPRVLLPVSWHLLVSLDGALMVDSNSTSE